MQAKLLTISSFVLASLLFATVAFAAEGQTVSYRSGNETVQAQLYMPKGDGPFPALVVIHEWWGLNDWVKEQASKFADEGYVALAIDLYRGQVATNPDEAYQIMRGVPEDRANRDLLAAVAYLQSLNKVSPKRVGAIGWCMGGEHALDLAIADPKLKVAVINYGHLSADKASLKRIRAVILGIFGGQDKNIPVADVRKFETQMMALKKPTEIHIFQDAGHAFENPNNQAGYRPDDAAKAEKLTQEFLQKNLK